ncbi:MAG: gamma carbonic anhydrase family protein [Bacteroidia bacterium]|nr:gamma carbonic anhydrase family protein [Bacteroidia bacterium]
MKNIITVKGITPKIDASAWVAENAIVTGDVTIGENSSVWFGCVIRGDCNKIILGNNVNIQDGSVVHGTVGRGDTVLGNNVSVGHRAIIHGCKIEDNVLVGMGAIILDDVVIPSHTIIAAGALITSGMTLESGYIYAGVPAKPIKKIDDVTAQVYIEGTSSHYVQYKEWYK